MRTWRGGDAAAFRAVAIAPLIKSPPSARRVDLSNVTLKVNGATHTLDIDPSTPLLYILRNDLGLQGPRFGCGLGQCGACTVIVNGNAVRSCITPTSAVKAEITTLEGLSKGGKLHP